MTNSKFKAKLAELNKALMSATTREEQDKADRAINELVDSYSPKIENTELKEANATALFIAG